MTYQPSHHRTTPASQRPPIGAAEFDAFLIDEGFDEFLDREIASFREILADDSCHS